ncbi:MAG: CoA-acylating methylmalonate-semialdehyde dehydrogenase [Mangrovibacterium sp.]
MKVLKNYINGSWVDSRETNAIGVINPATQEILGHVPLGSGNAKDVDLAVEAAGKAFEEWKLVPVMKRVQPLYRLKKLLEDHIDDLGKMITLECGKTFIESKAEIQRAIENVEVACGAPMLMQSEFSENIAPGIDEFMIRQPLGVCACIAPFNFPGMIPFWFLPYAIACGNTFIMKPSEKVPMTMQRVMDLIGQLDIPRGVVNLVHGGKETVDGLLSHPGVKTISFVGSTAVARYIYATGTANGKRVQAQGGAKNPVILLPDADIDMSARIIADSVYGCAGQRCLAASNVITVADPKHILKEALYEAAKAKVTGFGLDPDVDMGPVITRASKTRIENLIGQAVSEGAKVLLDGRNPRIKGYESGNFIKPTVLENVALDGETIKTEIFGPVMSLISMNTLDEAIDFVNQNHYGNMACIFTQSGLSARTFRSQANAGNIGINIGGCRPDGPIPVQRVERQLFRRSARTKQACR